MNYVRNDCVLMINPINPRYYRERQQERKKYRERDTERERKRERERDRSRDRERGRGRIGNLTWIERVRGGRKKEKDIL